MFRNVLLMDKTSKLFGKLEMYNHHINNHSIYNCCSLSFLVLSIVAGLSVTATLTC